MKKVLFILNFRNFDDEEFFYLKENLEKRGFQVYIASQKKGLAIGKEGTETKVDFLLSEIQPEIFDCLIILSSPSLKFLDNEETYSLIKKFFKRKKIIVALSLAPIILAKAGILKGKKATVWHSSFDKKGIKILKEKGVNFSEEKIVSDDKIITVQNSSFLSDLVLILENML